MIQCFYFYIGHTKIKISSKSRVIVILGSGSWARPVSETVIFHKIDYTICSLLSGTGSSFYEGKGI